MTAGVYKGDGSHIYTHTCVSECVCVCACVTFWLCRTLLLFLVSHSQFILELQF